MRNAVIPFDPFSGAVFAYTTSVLAIGPFVILLKRKCTGLRGIEPDHGMKTHQNLLPFNLYPPSTFSAFNFILTTSLPLPVSLIANAPICSPEISGGRYFSYQPPRQPSEPKSLISSLPSAFRSPTYESGSHRDCCEHHMTAQHSPTRLTTPPSLTSAGSNRVQGPSILDRL